ncbi:hypothetical protein [Streptomyces sp. NRRL F-2890]|uniref:hypothetical protein n=1 Tax=Streptomyces sp. NRRL F-2890 TaxID=1463845 RepID=UPI00131A5D5B|nr:hypothetical protein [Streptomyces sp. NRRL F-2890]
MRTPAYPPHGPLSTLADIRARRDLLTDAWARPRGPRENLLTEQEQEIIDRITAGHPPELMPEGPLPLIPVAQLYARDVPALSFPEGTDLLQILWAPFDDIEGCSDAVQLRWRRSSDVTKALTAPPEPSYVTDTDHVPSPCVLHPEEVQEFPPPHLLNEEQDSRVTAWAKARSADYWSDLSVAPGWKLGGWQQRWNWPQRLPGRCQILRDPCKTLHRTTTHRQRGAGCTGVGSGASGAGEFGGACCGVRGHRSSTPYSRAGDRQLTVDLGTDGSYT